MSVIAVLAEAARHQRYPGFIARDGAFQVGVAFARIISRVGCARLTVPALTGSPRLRKINPLPGPKSGHAKKGVAETSITPMIGEPARGRHPVDRGWQRGRKKNNESRLAD